MTRGDRMTRKEWETITIRDFDRLRADLAEANATIAAQSLALATMREALAEISGGAIETLDLTDRLYTNGRVADGVQIEFETHGPARRIREIKALIAQPDDAAGLAGAVLEAADLLKHRLDRLCECVNEFEPEDMTACGEYRDLLDDAILGVIRARAALRGHGAVDG